MCQWRKCPFKSKFWGTHFIPKHALLPLEKANIPLSSSLRPCASNPNHRSGRNSLEEGNSFSSWCEMTVDIPMPYPRGTTCRIGLFSHSPR